MARPRLDEPGHSGAQARCFAQLLRIDAPDLVLAAAGEVEADQIRTVQNIYAAFGRGDVPAILAVVQPDTSWDFAGARPDVPWHVPVKGAAELPEFFGVIARNVQMERFEPREFVRSGPHVMVEVRVEYTVKTTGRRVAMDQIHWWTFAGEKVARLRHFEDTAQVAAAVAA